MKRTWILFALLGLALRLPAQTNEAIRLALISESPDTGEVADVLTVDLGNHPGLHLLERDQIDKVYREQGLSAANRNYLKLGQVLGADGLLLLETATEDQGQFLNVRLVAVKPGVVLLAEKFPWPIKNLTEWSPAFAKHLEVFLPKLAVPLKEAIPLSIVNLRSAVSMADTVETERQLNLLVIQRLSREKQLFVLERQKMQLLSRENDLNGVDDSSFWKGSYLLEGTIDRDGYSQASITLSARLVPPHGGSAQPIELRASRTNLNDLLNQLAMKITGALKLDQNSVPWNAADEAEKFSSEAQWAYQWRLFDQAQAACESAWALGKRGDELALLRIHAYLAGGGLPATIRALDLFNREVALMTPNPPPLKDDWSTAGIELFVNAADLLDGYYLAAERREGNEDKLAELRLLMRKTLPFLDLQHGAQFSTTVRRPDGSSTWTSGGGIFGGFVWNKGGEIFERPEDAVPLFRKLLDDGYIPRYPPPIIGWKWEDRKRVPQLLKRFIEDSCASTNPPVRMTGLCLALEKTPIPPEPVYRALSDELIKAIWDNREWVWSRRDHAGIIEQGYRLMQDRSTDFKDMLFRLRKEYLTSLQTQTNFDGGIFGDIFGTSYVYSAPTNEARELTQLLDKLSSTNGFIAHVAVQLRKRAGLPPLPTEQKGAKPEVIPAEESMMVNYSSWNLKASGLAADLFPIVQKVIVRNNQLWVWILYLKEKDLVFRLLTQNHWSSYNNPCFYVRVDPETGQSESIPFPPQMGNPDEHYEVTKDALYVSVQDHLQRFRFREKTWDTIPVPMKEGAEITELGGQLYLSSGDSVLEVSPDSLAVQILASARRHPPANDVDTLLGSGPHKLFRGADRIGLETSNPGRDGGNQFLAFVPTNHTWQRLPGLTPNHVEISQPIRGIWKYYTDAGILNLVDGRSSRLWWFMAQWFDGDSPELLLRTQIRPPNPALQKQTPRWVWPKAYRIGEDYAHLETGNNSGNHLHVEIGNDFFNTPCLCTEGKSLWFLYGRKLVSHTLDVFHVGVVEPVINEDDRQATLLHFEPGVQNALTVPLRFQKDGQPINPFDKTFYRDRDMYSMGRGTFVPLLVMTKQGLVAVCPRLIGHWFIPKAELEKRFVKQRAAMKQEAETKTKKP